MIYVGLRLNKCAVTGFHRPHNSGGGGSSSDSVCLCVCVCATEFRNLRTNGPFGLLLLIASGGYNFENENRFALLKRITEWDCYVFSFIHIVQFFLSFCSVLRCISITIILICTMTNFTAHKIEYRIC